MGCAAALTGLAALLVPAIASAQITQVSSQSESRQTINFTIGEFSPQALGSRGSDDVWTTELQTDNPLSFRVQDFRSAIVGGEYLLGITRNLEAGVGVGFYQHTVPSDYATLVHQSGADITQDLRLRMTPISATARFLPLPRGGAVEPYVGVGVVVIPWNYRESGEFLDDQLNIFSATYQASGTAVGPTVLGGVRVPLGNFLAGGEVRWQHATAKGLFNQGFPSDKLDLGGWMGNFTFGVRF